MSRLVALPEMPFDHPDNNNRLAQPGFLELHSTPLRWLLLSPADLWTGAGIEIADQSPDLAGLMPPPKKSEIEMTSPIVQLVHLTGRRFVFLQEGANGLV